MDTTTTAAEQAKAHSPVFAPDANLDQEFKQVCHNQFDAVRDGEITLPDADRLIRAWVKNTGQPWTEAGISREIQWRARSNVTDKGSFPASGAPEGERPRDGGEWFWNFQWTDVVPKEGTIMHDFSEYAGMQTADEIAAEEAERQEAEDDLQSLARMRKGKGKFPVVGDCKICLVKIENRMSEGIENPEDSDDYEEDEEEDDDRTTKRSRREAKKARAQELENAQQKYNEANDAASERALKLFEFLENNIGGCCQVNGEKLAKGEGASYYGLMAFAPDSAEQDIALLMETMQRWNGAFVSWNMERLKGRKLSLTRIRDAIWCGKGNPNSPMDDDESNEAWIARIATSSQRLGDATGKLQITGGNPVLASTLGGQRFIERTPPSGMGVKGLVPNGGLTVLLGATTTGKTTLLHGLSVAEARGDDAWAGFDLLAPVDGPGLVAFASGEDPDWVTAKRQAALDPENRAQNILMINAQNGQQLWEHLRDLEGAKIRSLKVDPMRKYLDGSEDDSGVVSAFLTRLEEFARQTAAP